MPSNIDYIAFDLGRVLVDWNPSYLFSSLIKDEQRLAYMLENVVTMDWIEEVDRGKLLSQAVEERIAQFPAFRRELEEYGRRWIETIPNLIDGTVDIKRRLEDKGYPLYALSNFGRDTYADALKIYPELGAFTGAVISGHEGYIKPEPEIYKILLERYDLDAAKLLFIDDRADNVEMAQSLGFQAVQFISPDGLMVDLTRLAVL
jgi:2-haloacid dehalogenase